MARGSASASYLQEGLEKGPFRSVSSSLLWGIGVQGRVDGLSGLGGPSVSGIPMIEKSQGFCLFHMVMSMNQLKS